MVLKSLKEKMQKYQDKTNTQAATLLSQQAKSLQSRIKSAFGDPYQVTQISRIPQNGQGGHSNGEYRNINKSFLNSLLPINRQY